MGLPNAARHNEAFAAEGESVERAALGFSHPAECCSFFTHAPFAVLLVERSGRILAANEKSHSLFNIPLDSREVRISEIIADDKWERHNVMKAASERGSCEFDAISRKDHNTSFAIEVSVSLMPDQKDVVCVFIRDITQRKKLRREMMESEKKYRLLVENLTAGVVIIKEGFSVFANKGFMDIAGLSEIEIVAHPFVELFDTPYRPFVKNALEAASMGRQLTGPLEANIRRKSGELINLDMCLSATQYDGASAIQAIIQDVTEKKKIDEQLRLSARMASLGRIASGMAHEINNPLASLSIDIQRLLAKSRIRKKREQYARMLRTVHRVTRLAEDLLHAGKKKHYNFTYHDIKGHVENILNTMRTSFDEEDKKFRLTTQGHLPQVRGDGTQMDQVFINVTKNALEAMEPDGILDVSIRHLPLQNSVEIVFSDDGPGIPPGIMQHVFEPFFTTRKAGTGLGLAISKGIIEKLDGTLTLRNRKPHGLDVSIVLPAPPTTGGEPIPIV